MKVIISYFLMPQKCLSKNSEIQDYALCLGNFSKDFKKKVFLKIFEISQENTCTGVSF